MFKSFTDKIGTSAQVHMQRVQRNSNSVANSLLVRPDSLPTLSRGAMGVLRQARKFGRVQRGGSCSSSCCVGGSWAASSGNAQRWQAIGLPRRGGPPGLGTRATQRRRALRERGVWRRATTSSQAHHNGNVDTGLRPGQLHTGVEPVDMGKVVSLHHDAQAEPGQRRADVLDNDFLREGLDGATAADCHAGANDSGDYKCCGGHQDRKELNCQERHAQRQQREDPLMPEMVGPHAEPQHEKGQQKEASKHHGGHSPVPRCTEMGAPPGCMLINVETYLLVQESLVTHLAQQKELGKEVTQDDLIVWYMELKEDEFDTEQQIMDELRLVETVLWRTIEHDHGIVVTRLIGGSTEPHARVLEPSPFFF